MLKYDNNKPIYYQVIDDIKKRIINNTFHKNSKFPSTRELAIEYSINPNTAARVYKEMELQGLCYTKKGLGTYLSNEKNLTTLLKENMSKTLVKDFKTNMYALGFSEQELLELIKNGGNNKK